MNRTSGRLLFYFNIVLQLSLAVIFLNFFGIPSIQKYLQKETIIVFSEEQTDGIGRINEDMKLILYSPE